MIAPASELSTNIKLKRFVCNMGFPLAYLILCMTSIWKIRWFVRIHILLSVFNCLRQTGGVSLKFVSCFRNFPSILADPEIIDFLVELSVKI